MQYNWPLATNTFSLWERLKICAFFLKKSNMWTMHRYTREYEKKMARLVGCKYAVMTSSGSSSNQLIAQFVKDSLVKKREWPQRNEILVGCVSWATNVSVFIREGFKPVFIDVNLHDFCMDYVKLEKYLKRNHKKVACVFPTSVLGFVPNVLKLNEICQKYNVELKFDNCELFGGGYFDSNKNFVNVSSVNTSSSSGYVAHHINSGAEQGLIFTNSKEEYEYYILSRAHGLLRNLEPYKNESFNAVANNLVDSQFDFQTVSSNFRPTDIVAYLSLLNFEHLENNKEIRISRYNDFKSDLDVNKYYLPEDRLGFVDVPFCLPLIPMGEYKEFRLLKVKKYLDDNGIQRRSFISGNQLRQKAFRQYGNYKKQTNSEYLNNFGIYIGLNETITKAQIKQLTKDLNKI